MTDDMDVKTTVNGKMPKYNHLVLLAKNMTGYKNLIKLVSIAYVDGLYYKPRTDFKHLKEHAEGLVCLSACLAANCHRQPQGDMDSGRRDYRKIQGAFRRRLLYRNSGP